MYGVVVAERVKPNLARELVFEEKLPNEIEAHTISSYCITGLRTIASVVEAIQAGRISCGIAGGVDSLSHSDPNTFNEPSAGLSMGQHTELTRKTWNISRARQDEIALASHERPPDGSSDYRSRGAFTKRARARGHGSHRDSRRVRRAGARERCRVGAGWKAKATSAVDGDKVNVNGSSIAVGHPWAATGGRIVTTLANEIERRDTSLGLVSICAAGAMAGAFILERG